MKDSFVDYRESHTSIGYGAHYNETYKSGYYAAQWRDLEAPLLRRVLKSFFEGGATRYLDFACGTGRILSLASTVFEDVSGIDISDDMAKHAALLVPSAKIHAPRDITREPLRGSYDVITAFRFFLNAQPELRTAVLCSLGKMQATGGVLICNIHVNSRSLLGRIYKARNKLRGKTLAKTLDLETLQEALEVAGYSVESVYYYSYFPRLGPYAPRLQEFLLTSFERMNFLPAEMAQSIMLVCRKA